MRLHRPLTAVAAVAVLAVVSIPAAQADGEFTVTANGVASMGAIADLPQTSEVSLAVSNLPSGVGLYAFHCLVPPREGSPVPTRCDYANGTQIYLPATSPRTATVPIVINAQFEGKDPNPMSPDTGTTDIDCRAQMCALYTLGAGRESSNPAYVKVFFTTFSAVAPQEQDRIRAQIRGQVIKGAWQPRVSYSTPSPFQVTLTSGLQPSLSSDACQVSQSGTIRALKKSGTCTVTIMSTGNDGFAPAEREITFRLVK